MQLWQLDVMGGIRLANGSEAKLVDGIDDHSRYCVLAKAVARATARPVCATFAEGRPAGSRDRSPDGLLRGQLGRKTPGSRSPGSA